MDQLQIADLVCAARTGDRAAFGVLVARQQDAAVAFCYGRLGDRERARDAAQDAFIDAYLHLSQLNEPAAFSAWFRRVLLKHCDRRWRRSTVDPDALAQHMNDGVGEPGDAEAALLLGERASLARASVEALPEHERTAVALFYLADQSLAEIGALLEVEPNAIKQRLHSARQRLRERSELDMREQLQPLKPSNSAAFSDQVGLFLAIRTGDEAAVRTLLARDPALIEASEAWDPHDWPERDLPVANRATPLIRAAELGRLGIVRALLDAGAGVDGGCGCFTRESALWAATVSGQREVAAELLARGADPGRGAASGIACLHVAALRGDRVLVELLLAHGADPAQRDHGGRNAADWARIKGHDELLALLAPLGVAPAPEPRERAPERGAPVQPSSGAFCATGIKALDLFAPLSEGALVLVQGGAGVGRNILLAELAQRVSTRADSANVWALWQREPWSDAELDGLLNETALGAHVHVLRHGHADGDELARELPARALEACERLLRAGTRHVQLALFERPGVRAAIEALLPKLGPRADGTAITTLVVPPWQASATPPSEPRAPFDACIGFDPALVSALCFPAIDAVASRNRSAVQGLPPAHATCATEARALLATLARPAEHLPATLDRARRLRAYLTQPFHVAEPFSGRPGVSVPLPQLLADVRAILDGAADELPIERLAYRGVLEGAAGLQR